jgi:hydrogenase maturation protease
LRGDDGVGAAVGARLRHLGVPPDALRTVSGLLPELAADVAVADAVLFVDAAADLQPGEVRVTTVAVEGGSARWTHQLSPDELLALTAAAYGRVPPATLVAVGGRAWDMGTSLSADVEAQVPRVARIVAAWREEACGEASRSR